MDAFLVAKNELREAWPSGWIRLCWAPSLAATMICRRKRMFAPSNQSRTMNTLQTTLFFFAGRTSLIPKRNLIGPGNLMHKATPVTLASFCGPELIVKEPAMKLPRKYIWQRPSLTPQSLRTRECSVIESKALWKAKGPTHIIQTGETQLNVYLFAELE